MKRAAKPSNASWRRPRPTQEPDPNVEDEEDGVEDEEYEMKARSKPGEISYSRDERAMNEGASEGGGSKRH